jgi:hypothetical protein
MNDQQMRQWLQALYPQSTRWLRKVDKMSHVQIVAIYLRLKKRELNHV